MRHFLSAGDVERAAQLVWSTDAMVVVVGASLLAWVTAGWLLARSGAPGATHVSCVAAGAGLVFGRMPWPVFGRMPWLTGVRAGSVPRSLDAVSAPRRTVLAPPGLTAASSVVRAAALLPAMGAAGAVLFSTGGVPSGPWRSVLLAAVVVAAAGFVTSLAAVIRERGRKEWLAARGPHMLAATVLGEVLLAGACLAVALVITRTEGTTVGLLGAGAAAVIARGITTLRLPAAGALVADVTFVAMLVGAGYSLAASLAIVAVWRATVMAAWLLGVLGPRHRRLRGVTLTLSVAPTGSALGELFHRSVFRIVGALPAPVAARVRAGIFDTLFRLAEDPWRYDSLPYEQRKRSHLLARLPAPGPVIVEVGCADGHNLQAIAAARPDALVVGLDISPVAVAAAARRNRGAGNVRVLRADARRAPNALARAGITQPDVVILAEMLYYVGSPARVRAELAPLAATLAPEAAVVLLHDTPDARRLHRPAIEALGCFLTERFEVDDPDRPFVVEVARRSRRAART